MNSNNSFSREPSVSLKELLWQVLEHRKVILLVACSIALLFLASVYLRSQKAANQEKETQSANQKVSAEDIIGALPENQRAGVAGAYSLYQENNQLSVYMQNAPIMKIDPTKAERLRLSWVIEINGEAEGEDDKNELALAYRVELESSEFREALLKASNTNLNSRQFSELIIVTYPDAVGRNMVCCDIFLTEDMDKDALQKEADKYIDDSHDKLKKAIKPHELKNYQNEISDNYDKRILERQTIVLNNYATISLQIDNLRNQFTPEQKEAFAQLQALNTVPTKEEQVGVPARTITMRNVLLGLLLGVLVCVCFCFLYALLSHRIHDASALKAASIRILGKWYDVCAESKKNPIIRGGIIWKRHHRNHLDLDMELEKTVSLIESICQYKSIDKLLLILTATMSNAQDQFIHGVAEKLRSQGITLYIDDINENDLDDRALVISEGVVLTVIDSKTEMQSLVTACDLCDYYETPIIGGVYLG